MDRHRRRQRDDVLLQGLRRELGRRGLALERALGDARRAATVPGAPTLNSASAGNGSVALAWSAPASDGGSAVTGYKVYRGTSSGGETLLATLGNVHRLDGHEAANGMTYYYQVSAVNSVGEGARSNERSATPVAAATVPGAPTLNSATAGNGSVALAWSAPASTAARRSPGTGSTAAPRAAARRCSRTLGTVTSWTDTPASNGTTYYYKVSAVNSVGEGALSNERSATPAAPVTVPGAPTLNSATAGNGSVALAWSAPVRRRLRDHRVQGLPRHLERRRDAARRRSAT